MASERASVPRRWNPTLLALLAVVFTASCSRQGEAPRRHAAHGAPGALVEEKSIVDLQAELTAGRVSSVQLVDAYFARIDALDDFAVQLQNETENAVRGRVLGAEVVFGQPLVENDTRALVVARCVCVRFLHAFQPSSADRFAAARMPFTRPAATPDSSNVVVAS